MSEVFTQNLHVAGNCSSCGPTMVSRQGMPGWAPATWHCDSCSDCGPGIRPSMGVSLVDAVFDLGNRVDLAVANFFWECRMGRLSTIGWVRWLAESFGD